MATGDPKNEIHHILKDANGDGAAPDVLNDGDNAVSADGQLVFTGWNQAGAARTLQHQTEGAAALAENISIMPLKDASNNIQYLKGSSTGALVVTLDDVVTEYSGRGYHTPSSSGSEEEMFTIGLGSPGELILGMEWQLSSDRDVQFDIYYVDDAAGAATATRIFTMRVNGDEDSCCQIKNLNLDTSGGTGVQELSVRMTQKQGTAQESFAYVCVKV